MRSVHVSGGFGGEVEVELTDSKGQSLQPAAYKVGLIPVDGPIPAADSDEWRTPTSKTFPKAGQAVLTLQTDSSFPLGTFWPYVQISDSGRAPELVRADDYVELT